MASTELEILLKADVDQATKAIERFAKQVGVEIKEGISIYDAFDAKIKEVEASLKKASDPKDVARLTKELKSLQATFSTIKSDRLFQAGEGIGKAGKAAANATPALTNFGRVIQDAPFGIIGIANNIDPLISSFQSLSKTAGGTGGALKALFSSLAGPAGIAIAVSTVTSALVAFGPEIANAINGISAFDKAVNDAFAEGAGAAIKAQREFSKYFSILQDGNASFKAQKDALDDINKLLDKYNLKINDVSAAQKIGAQVGLIYAEVKRQEAIATAFADAAAKSEVERVRTLSQTTSIAANASGRLRIELEKFFKAGDRVKAQKLGTEVKLFGDNADKADAEIKKLRDSLLGLPGVTEDFNESLKTLKPNADEYNASILALGVNTNSLTKLITAEKDEALALAQAIDKARTATEKKNIADKAAALIKATEGGQQAPAALGRLTVPTAITDVQASNAKLTAAAIQQVADATNNTNAAFNLLSPAIDQAFNALANGENAAEAVGQAVKQLVVQLIKAVIQAALLSAILNAISGGAAGGANSFISLFSKLLGFRAAGGAVSASSPYIVGESGPELFVPGTSGQVVPNMALQGGGTLQATVRGSDLLFILNNAQRNRGGIFG